MAILRRRTMLLTAAAALLPRSGLRAAADEGDFAADHLPDYASHLGGDRLSALGLATPLPREVAMARDILNQAPRSAPHEIMAWLEALRETNDDGERYNEGWRVRWNPVIVAFFAGTGTAPAGDETPWCAACLNWCIARSGLRGTGSASSGSFRSGSRGETAPRLGDIAVFRDDSRGPGKGHVGFYVGGGGEQITLLGANQTTRAGHHGICRKPYAVRSSRLELDSFRSIAEFGGSPPPAPRPDRKPVPPPAVRPRRPGGGGGEESETGIGRW